MEGNILKIVREISSNIKEVDFIEKNLKNEKIIWNPLSLANGYPSILLLIGEMMNVDAIEEWENIAHEYVIKINDELENSYYNSSLFLGLTGIAAGIYSISLNGRRYKNILDELNSMILQYTREFLYQINSEINDTKDYYYDTVTGLSGVLRYLIEIREEKHVEETIKDILNYFVLICGEVSCSGIKIPRYLVKDKSIEDKEAGYINGVIDMGLAHGIAGIMMSMSLALKSGIEVKGQHKAIEKLLKVYKRYKYDDGKKTIWPGQLSYKDLLNSKDTKYVNRASWCYGVPGVARAIYLSSKIVNDKDGIELSLKALREQANINLDEYGLNSPTICHGFSGVLIVNELMYRDTEEIIFKESNIKIAKRILDYYDKGNVIGFKNVEVKDDIVEMTDDIGFLTGVAGVLLALMNYIEKNDTHWEKFLLLD